MILMPISDVELERQLTAAGKALSRPLSSMSKLLHLLDRAEKLLSRVEQSPTNSMLAALSPIMDVLTAEEFLKHADVDVKVGVASCISEIMRITAPDAPYDDDKMKEIFYLIVSAFEDLSNTANRSYFKRVTILKTMAKVRYCLIMLDLEMDQIIIELFPKFLRATKVQQSEIVVESMETVMSLVLDDSEDKFSALITPILAVLTKNHEEALPNARKLTEKVLQNCAKKLRSYMTHALKTLDQKVTREGSAVALPEMNGTESMGWEYSAGQLEIIDFPTVDDCIKGSMIYWVCKI